MGLTLISCVGTPCCVHVQHVIPPHCIHANPCAPAQPTTTARAGVSVMEFKHVSDPQLTDLLNYVKQRREHVHVYLTTADVKAEVRTRARACLHGCACVRVCVLGVGCLCVCICMHVCVCDTQEGGRPSSSSSSSSGGDGPDSGTLP